MGGKTINDLSTITSLGGTEKFPVSVDGNTLNSITFDSINRYTTGVNISNCITKIPQDINVEFSSGNVTLKAGSKVYNGNGDAINITDDVDIHSGTIGTVSDYFVFGCNSSGKFGYRTTLDKVASGATDPGTGFNVWYDTTNKDVKYSSAADGQWAGGFSLPVCIYKRENGNAVSVKHVFNGFGYIGSTMFALPGVEGLIPNGRTNLGQLTSINLKLNSVVQSTFGVTSYSGPAIMYLNTQGFIFQALDMYDPVSNTMTDSQYSGMVQSARIYITSGKITSMDNIIPIKYVDYNDFNRITNTLSYDYVIEQNISGANWYRKWKSGWLEQGVFLASASGTITVNLLKPFKNTSYIIQMSTAYTGTYSTVRTINQDNKTVSSFQLFMGDVPMQVYIIACGVSS